MRRPRFGSVLAAVAIATAGVIPIFVSPAGATNNCGPGAGSAGAVNASAGSEFPVGPGALAELKVDCHSDAGVSPDNIIIHDAPNGIWHHGAGRHVAITPTDSSATITFAAGAITALDVSRPIAYTCQTGGSFIVAVPTTTTATLSKASKTGCAPTTATIDYTTNRVLQDVTCASGGLTLTGTANDKFAASDVGKSVTGGPFGGAGGGSGGGNATGVWRIVSVTATTATLNATAPAACAAADVITLGGQSYNTTTPFAATWPNNPMTVELSNSTSGGQGFTCSGSNLALAGTATTAIPAFSAAWTNLKVVVRGTTTVTTKVNSFSSPNLVLAAACPSGVTATSGSATVGETDANAPANNAAMMELNAELNLNPALVKTQDDCTRNTIEGFEVVGAWKNPGSYGAGTTPVPVSTGQIVYPTAVVSFSGNIVPRKGGDAQIAGQHFDFVFPSLPTSSAVCLTPPVTGTPSNPTQLALAFASTTLSGDINGNGPYLQTGSGNPQDPTIRALDQRFSQTFNGRYELRAGTTNVAGSPGNTFSCTIPASTAAPSVACGDG